MDFNTEDMLAAMQAGRRQKRPRTDNVPSLPLPPPPPPPATRETTEVRAPSSSRGRGRGSTSRGPSRPRSPRVPPADLATQGASSSGQLQRVNLEPLGLSQENPLRQWEKILKGLEATVQESVACFNRSVSYHERKRDMLLSRRETIAELSDKLKESELNVGSLTEQLDSAREQRDSAVQHGVEVSARLKELEKKYDAAMVRHAQASERWQRTTSETKAEAVEEFKASPAFRDSVFQAAVPQFEKGLMTCLQAVVQLFPAVDPQIVLGHFGLADEEAAEETAEAGTTAEAPQITEAVPIFEVPAPDEGYTDISVIPGSDLIPPVIVNLEGDGEEDEDQMPLSRLHRRGETSAPEQGQNPGSELPVQETGEIPTTDEARQQGDPTS